MENTKRFTTTLGILLIVTILISGSVVAGTWHHVTWIFEEDTTNTDNINGAPDGSDATIGVNGIFPNPDKLGWVFLDLGSGNEMGLSQNFTVFANSSVREEYDVWVSETNETISPMDYCGRGNDTYPEEFWTPSTHGKVWRGIYIKGVTGVIGTIPDPIYGPDIDAVGWWEP